MVTKFTKRQLLDQCGFTADEAKIILEYQKKLPILVENDGIEGFCINARDLHLQLGVGKKFSEWIKQRIKVYSFAESLDFTQLAPNGETRKFGGNTRAIDYMLTIDMAKQLCMIEKNENGTTARRYFILMEKAVKRNIDWELIRYPLREGYKKMQKALDDYMLRMIQRNADDWDYRIEADVKAQEIRAYVDCKDNITRDSLTATYNEYLLKMQELNIVYLGMNMNRYDRYKMLKQSFDILFPNAVPIRDDVGTNRIIENKNKLLEEVRMKVEKVA